MSLREKTGCTVLSLISSKLLTVLSISFCTLLLLTMTLEGQSPVFWNQCILNLKHVWKEQLVQLNILAVASCEGRVLHFSICVLYFRPSFIHWPLPPPNRIALTCMESMRTGWLPRWPLSQGAQHSFALVGLFCSVLFWDSAKYGNWTQ